jgi:apolipoprotein N-acyltransferase
VTALALVRPRSPTTPGRRRRRARRPPLVALVGAAASGGALLAASPPAGIWPLAPVGVALLALAVHRVSLPRAYALGLLAGGCYLVPLLAWARAPGVDAWLALAAVETALFALTAAGLALTSRLRLAPLWGTGLWVLSEHLRDTWPFGGLPWARLAFTQAGSPFAPLAALGGAPLVTAAVAISGLLLAAVALAPHRRVRALTAVAAIAVGAAGLAVPLPTGGAHIQVAVVQGNVPRAGYAGLRQASAVLTDHVQQTLTLGARIRAGTVPAPALVVWPEDADDIDPFQDRAAADELTVASTAVDAPLLVGAVLNGPRPHTALNAGLLWTQTGYGGQEYLKQHPVPFGEYLPFRPELAPLIPQVRTLLPDDMLAGTRPGVLHIGGVRVGDVICFEVAYDGLVRRTVNAGAQILVVQTNNATFGRDGETWQQLAMARLRAVEHGRSVVVAATSGASALIAPNGTVIARSALFTPALLNSALVVRSGRTVADRVGAWPEHVLEAVGLLGLLGGVVQGRWARRRPAVQGRSTG